MTTKDEATGVINPDELYTLDAFKRRLGIQAATFVSTTAGFESLCAQAWVRLWPRLDRVCHGI